jgi:class 3 adenylate cyclase
VLHHADDAVIHVENARYLAAHIRGARLIIPEGRDHAFFFEGTPELHEALAWLVDRESRSPAERFLSTVLVIEGQVDDCLDEVDAVAATYRGVKAAPRGYCFDGPARAIECAHTLIARCARGGGLGIGVHTGELFRSTTGLDGSGLEIARRIAGLCAPGEVVASGIVRDLLYGAGLCFEEYSELALSPGHMMPVLRSIPPVRKR